MKDKFVIEFSNGSLFIVEANSRIEALKELTKTELDLLATTDFCVKAVEKDMTDMSGIASRKAN
ncbi:hypothetical protein [Salirhabdus salicampi]|uniref:hypothetical protein n=1 Tax=Salirhabdus salicampi TaxID=476102 RepID=UPI0020C355E9|nr:hypothetical protein [Salirhabdus salicampi]MCP8615372.1 hypothetical protein [Salirhabdus salicampi]